MDEVLAGHGADLAGGEKAGDGDVAENLPQQPSVVVRPLEQRMTLTDAKILVLGAGGAARAAVFGLKDRGSQIFVLNRNLAAAQKLARQAKARTLKRPDLKRLEFDVIINATPVGMAPQSGGCILSPNAFAQSDLDGKIFFDAIYNPLQTVFLKSAQLAGAHTISGLGMMLHQGREAFRLWTNEIVPSEALKTTRELLESQIDRTRGRT